MAVLVVVAQLVELWFVVPAVAGSSPVYHPSLKSLFMGLFGYAGDKLI